MVQVTALQLKRCLTEIIRQAFEYYLDDIEDLRCGVAAVDNYFKKTANKLAESGNVRLFVMVNADQALIGLYAINAHAVEGQGSIPAAFIAMIDRDVRFSGAGFGADLLVDALRGALRELWLSTFVIQPKQAFPATQGHSRTDSEALIHPAPPAGWPPKADAGSSRHGLPAAFVGGRFSVMRSGCG